MRPSPPRIGDEIRVGDRWHRVSAVRRAPDCVKALPKNVVEEFAVTWRSKLGGNWAALYWEADVLSSDSASSTIDCTRVEETKRHHRVT